MGGAEMGTWWEYEKLCAHRAVSDFRKQSLPRIAWKLGTVVTGAVVTALLKAWEGQRLQIDLGAIVAGLGTAVVLAGALAVVHLARASRSIYTEQQERLKDLEPSKGEGARLRNLSRIADQLRERLKLGAPLSSNEDPHVRSKLQEIESASSEFAHRSELQEALRKFHDAASTMLGYRSYKERGGIREFSSREAEQETTIALEQSFSNLWRVVQEFLDFDDVALTSSGLSWKLVPTTRDGRAVPCLRVWPTGELPQPLNLIVTSSCQLGSIELIPDPSRPDEKSDDVRFHVSPSQGKRLRLRLVYPKLEQPAYINIFLQPKKSAPVQEVEVKRELNDLGR